MARNGFSLAFAGNGHEDVSFSLRLSTGYEVQINGRTAKEDFTHLSRALFGEIFLEKAKEDGKKGDWEAVAAAVIDEIDDLVTSMNKADASNLLKLSLWRDFIKEYGRIERGTRKSKQGNKKKK